jgi:hypothetical protein
MRAPYVALWITSALGAPVFAAGSMRYTSDTRESQVIFASYAEKDAERMLLAGSAGDFAAVILVASLDCEPFTLYANFDAVNVR